MIKFSALLKGSEEPEPPGSLKPLPVEEEDAPPPPGRFMFNPAAEAGFDLDVPGIVLNPDWVDPAEHSIYPKQRQCGSCGQAFTSEPIVWAGKCQGTPLFCPACAARKTEQLLADCPIRNPQNIYAPRYLPGLKQSYDNFCGYRLRKRVTRAISAAAMDTEHLPVEVIPPTTAPTGHAKHGPSSLKHKEICPLWRGDKSTNAVAEEGTMLHERLVTRNFGGLEPEPLRAVTLVSDLFDELKSRMGPDAQVYEERRVNVADMTWGTSDLIIIAGTKAIVADAKFGWHQVEDAEVNAQGWCYAVGVFHEFKQVQEIEVVFAQPRTDSISTHTFTRKNDYDRMRLRIATILARIEDPDAQPNPDYYNCLYCGAKATCPAMHQLALKAAPTDPEALAIPERLQPEHITEPAMMARALMASDLLEKWIEGVRSRAKEMAIQEGNEIPGYEVAERKAPRSITNPMGAWNAVKDVISPEDYITAVKTVSIGDLEKLFAANAPRGAKGQAKQALEDRLINEDALKQEGTVHYLRKLKPKPKQLAEQTVEQ